MPRRGKIIYPDATASPGNAKFQGGGSRGKSSKLNKSKEVLPKQIGTPRDKGVNR
jgi:hypothetical protein